MSKDIRDKKIMSKMKLLTPEEIFSPADDRDFHQEDVMKATLILPEEYLAPRTSILNQGTVGSCVAHALVTCLAQGQEVIFNASDNFFPRLYLCESGTEWLSRFRNGYSWSFKTA